MWAWGIPLAAVLGTAHIVARYGGASTAAAVLKAMPIALLAAWAALEPVPVDQRYRWLVVAGLVASIGGDVALLFPSGFVPGLSSFLVAHLCYIAAFAPGGAGDARPWLLLAPFAVVGVAMLVYLWPHLGKVRIAVIVYVSAIVTMAWRATLRADVAAAPWPSTVLVLVGALFFMVSDGVLSIDRFAGTFPAADAIVMSTYYAAQILIARSVAR